jgi:hypothetical protein
MRVSGAQLHKLVSGKTCHEMLTIYVLQEIVFNN